MSLPFEPGQGGQYKVQSNRVIFGIGSNNNNKPYEAFKFDTRDSETIELHFSRASRPIQRGGSTCWDEGMRDNCINLYYYGGEGREEMQQSERYQVETQTQPDQPVDLES